jgi:DNA polymerase III delta prime subunit
MQMTRIFIRDEHHCGQRDTETEDYVKQFETPVLFGRTHEIGLLNQAWVNSQSRLFLLHGETGIGKTALMHKWLHALQKKHWHDAETVFLWSFYPPDLTQSLQDPVEEFFRYALHWFGGEAATRCPNLLQGEYLAKLVSAHHTLLILDGLETLQYTKGSSANQVGDPRLNVLLERLAAHNTGLCVVISREPLQGNFSEDGVQRHALEKLSVDAAAECLSHKGVQADSEKLRQMAVDYGQNPLTLSLLGGYLSVWHAGDWQRMDQIPVLMDQQADGRQARRIIVANATELYGKPSEAILYLLSLLYRPVHWETLEALLSRERGWSLPPIFKRPPQDNYASRIAGFLRLSQRKRYQAILQLRELGLLELSGRCFWLPLWVREAYQRQFKYDWPEAWKQTNAHLMQYHTALPPDTDTLANIIPLTVTQKSVKVTGPFGKLITPTAAPEPVMVAEPVAPVETREPTPEFTEASVYTPNIDLAWFSSITPALTATLPPATTSSAETNNVAESIDTLVTADTVINVSSEPVVDVIPEPSPPQAPALQRADLDNMIELMTQLKRYQNTLHTLQIRTKKYQKQVRQLDKEVQACAIRA